MLKLKNLAIGACLFLMACAGGITPQNVATQEEVQATIQTTCAVVEADIGLANTIAGVIPQVAAATTAGMAACGSADAISALVTEAMKGNVTDVVGKLNAIDTGLKS